MDSYQVLHVLYDNPLLIHVLPLFGLLILIEILVDQKQQLSLYTRRDALESVFLVVVAWIVEVLPKGLALLAMDALSQLSPLHDVMQYQWWVWILAIFADDLVYYIWHRASHEVRLLWAGHVNHHSSKQFNFLVGIRAGVGERITKPIFWLPLPLFGFPVDILVAVANFNLLYQLILHTRLIGVLPRWYEAIFNTPSHHRVHHASNTCYLDRNHGGLLIIWDRLFGTFAEEDPITPPRFGLVHNIKDRGWPNLVWHEYSSIRASVCKEPRWQDKLRTIFGPPETTGKADAIKSPKIFSAIYQPDSDNPAATTNRAAIAGGPDSGQSPTGHVDATPSKVDSKVDRPIPGLTFSKRPGHV